MAGDCITGVRPDRFWLTIFSGKIVHQVIQQHRQQLFSMKVRQMCIFHSVFWLILGEVAHGIVASEPIMAIILTAILYLLRMLILQYYLQYQEIFMSNSLLLQ